jgi:hypothetical protein
MLGIHPQLGIAGAASAVVGFLQFAMAAVVAPLPGLRGGDDPLPMAILIVGFPAAAIGTMLALSGRVRRAAATTAAIDVAELTVGDAVLADCAGVLPRAGLLQRHSQVCGGWRRPVYYQA